MEKLKCLKCEHEWLSRKNGRPLSCPNCKNRKWDLDNGYNKCEVCNRNFLKLCVHHKDGNDYNNDESNLIRICQDCHLFIHNPIKKHSDGKKYLSRTRKYKDNNNVKNKLIDLNKYWNLYKSKTNEIQYDKIKKLYKEGKSYGNIAKILNIGLGTVRYQLVPGEKEKIRLRIKNNKKIERGSK